MKSPKTFVVSLLAALIAGPAAYLAWNSLASSKPQGQMKDALGEKSSSLENLDVKSTVTGLKEKSASEKLKTLNGIPIGAVVELDKTVAAQNDKIQIVVVAPYLNDPKRVDTIGGGGNRGSFSIRSSKGMLQNFELKELGQDRGIYAGEVILSPNKLSRLNSIRVAPEDAINCAFQGPQGVSAQTSALVRQSIAELTLEKKGANSILVKVVDPDLNDIGKRDGTSVKAWSDSDALGINVSLEETEEDTGTFIGEFKLSETPSSERERRLHAPTGQTVTVDFKDFKLPAPYGKDDSLDISTTLSR